VQAITRTFHLLATVSREKIGLSLAVLAILVPFFLPSPCQAQSTGWGLWSGLLVRDFRPDSRFDYSGEYQVRLTEDLQELKSHFFEFSGYYKANSKLESNFGYRFTIRPDRKESRLFAGLFYRTTPVKPNPVSSNLGLRLTHQLMYQRDFDASFNDLLVDSNTLRYALYLTKPFTPVWHGLLIGGAMYTWNAEYTGLEKVRAAIGVRIRRKNNDGISLLYVRERRNQPDSTITSNIVWLRYEAAF
jgi:hypothetical protein